MVLLVNTWLAQGSFTVHTLTIEQSKYADDEQALTQSIAQRAAPQGRRLEAGQAGQGRRQGVVDEAEFLLAKSRILGGAGEPATPAPVTALTTAAVALIAVTRLPSTALVVSTSKVTVSPALYWLVATLSRSSRSGYGGAHIRERTLFHY